MTVLVVGLGSPQGGDDAVGLVVAERLRTAGASDLHVVSTDAPASLLDLWEGFDDVVLVDATRSGAPPGTVTTRRLRGGTGSLPTGARGTHGFGVAEVLALGRALDRLPRTVTLIGVEAGSFDRGEELSPPVRAGVATAVRAVVGLTR